MSAPSNPQQESESFAKRLGRRLSFGGDTSKETTKKETTTGQHGIGQQVHDKADEVKQDISKGDFKGAVKDVAGKGENTKTATQKGDVSGAASETNRDEINKKNFDDVGKRLFGSRSGPILPNDDIKKGPITAGDQRDSVHTGQGLYGATGSGSATGFRDITGMSPSGYNARPLSSTGPETGAIIGSTRATEHESAIGPKDISGSKPKGSKIIGGTGGNESKETAGFGPNGSKVSSGSGVKESKETTDSGPTGSEPNRSKITSSGTAAGVGAGTAAVAGVVGSANHGRTGTNQENSAKNNIASGQNPTENSPRGLINQELAEHSHISSDVFDDGNTGKSKSKGGAGLGFFSKKSSQKEKASSGSSSGNVKANKKSTTTQQGELGRGVGTVGMGAAGLGAAGLNKTGLGQRSTTTGQPSNEFIGQGKQNTTIEIPRKEISSVDQKNTIARQTGNTYSGLGDQTMTSGKTRKEVSSMDQKSSTSRHTSKSDSEIPGMGGQPAMSGQTGKGMSDQSGLAMRGIAGGGLKQDFNEGEISPGSYSRAENAQLATKGTTDTSGGIGTTRTVKNLGGSSYKLTILQEKVQAVSQKCKTQLGLSANEISQRSPTVDAFFDAVAAERLRWMPRDGSRLDCCLRWASRLAYTVDALRESVGAFAPGANEAAKLIWGYSIMLLESDLDNTDVFERVFGRYGRVAVGIRLLLQYESAFINSPELQPEAAAVYSDLLEMICSTTGSCIEGSKSKESPKIIEHNVDAAFVSYALRYSTHWNAIVESATFKAVEQSSLIFPSPELGSLRQFLSVQDRPLQFILDSRAHSLAEGSFEWFNNSLYEFSVGDHPVMMVTGGPGAGKSALAQWTVERMQESAEHEEWHVIPYTIRADIPVATLPLRILKGILHQMLDHCVSEKSTQEDILFYVAKAAQGALDGEGEAQVEEYLWKGIHTGLATEIKYMFVVDGLDQIKGGDVDATTFLDKFSTILDEQDTGSKMITFTRPLSSHIYAKNTVQFKMQTSQTQKDLTTYIQKALSSGFSSENIKSKQMESAVIAIVNRSQGSFSWAEMAVANARQQRTLDQAVQSVQSLPQSASELLDVHMKNLDLNQTETRCVMQWLAAAERPLLVQEIEQLMAVDFNTPSFISRLSRADSGWSKSLSPVILTRDGVVSFAHTSIREHVINLAKSDNAKATLNYKGAHLDILMRCLAWVQLSVREETEVSTDKLGMEERNRLFDKYVMLEYTARYWLSHLLFSKMITDDGEFQFTASFKKLVPVTVLFARLELTCRESQFTRSSVIELYRLATDIRRVVLGEKSMALLQSLLLSARVSNMAHASLADEQSYEAWKLSQELLGQSDKITLSCAEMMTKSFGERGTMSSQQEDIMKYWILTDSDITGVDFNQRLKYLGMVVSMNKSHSDNTSALLISKQFYQQILLKYGTNSRQSSSAADFLTGQFSTTGSDEMSRDIARTKYDNVIRTMEVTDERRITHTFAMAQLYEQQGEHAQAQSVLSSMWAGLNSRDIDSVDVMDKKGSAALAYYQFLRRQGRNDEAEVIIRELVADLEVTGIHSPEMMQRVQLLRAETREIHMYSLDRSLSILMWHYYKETNQEYSADGTKLAMSLARSMANTNTIEDTMSMSGGDRKLMIQLLDSITSSTNNLSVSTLILCHNLASIYVREEDWAGASDCSKAVLQHIWPTVEQAGSHKKFGTDLAPPIADIALILAYCHFRRLRLEHATIVYENAFGTLLVSEKVPVASVLAVAKAVVEFYETTFQFNKALVLLHSVSNFLTSRIGETHRNTIENLYLEANLANRLEMSHEAKNTYQRIYKCTMRDNKVAPEGVEASLALITLYEKGLQWDSALEVYRHLWPTLVVEESTEHSSKERIQIERMLEKTYMGYTSILSNHPKSSSFAERYKVASDYVTTCRNVYGPTHQKTLNATLLFAELCESSDSYTDQAISLYKIPLQTNEWIPASQSSKGLDQMTQPLPITLKHKLAQLFVRKRDSTNEARTLYTEEYQLAKKHQGYFSTTTLSWLRELALAHSRQGTPASVQQGNALLHTYTTDVLHAGGDSGMMADWARKIASIYLECGFIDGGNGVLDELRRRVVYGSDTSAMALGDRRDAVFVAAFEETFGRRATHEQIITEMTREMHVHQTFTKNLSGHDFIPTLVAGDRLSRLQTEQKRTRAAKESQDKLYDYFCATLSAIDIANRDIVHQFYLICLREVHNENHNTIILNTTTSLVRDLCNSSQFQEASDITGVLHSFLHLTDGLNNYDNIITATKLGLYLSGHSAKKCHSEKLFNEMSIKSKLLLQEIMASSKAIGIEIVDLPFTELNDIITLLGEYEMFDDLEAILTQLWTSRIVQRTWTPDVVVWIGRRLVETRFCRGSVDSAIQLCRDICYNLRQVWGSCDSVTLDMTKLLSGLFTASGDHQSAVTLHEGILFDMLSDSDAKEHPKIADIVSQHMELYRRAKSRLGSGKSSRPSAHPDIIALVTERFGLQSEQISGVGDANGGEQFGVWSRPRRFSIDVEDLDDQGQLHHNHLRESSGPGLSNGNGAPRRISVQAL
ncbi:hypothetical protein N7495_008723 [Penicillium taxi]|uniref:uncharacterized protein n=1 Tax=Penicillium taxi TaxID=168475 RepID=UPI0025453E96|nr:uncharacterized protein N7495_008723 [Penicillium taxi]KAJ5888682.1 hypothetical protein N7495_008723 [Penicillium taxi]